MDPSWPKTVDEAVNIILTDMSEADKEAVKNTSWDDLIQYHFGWGTNIRNSFGLWQGNSALVQDAKASNPDEASMFIIQAVWKELQE